MSDTPTGWGIPAEDADPEVCMHEEELPPMPRGERPYGQGFKNLFARFGYDDDKPRLAAGGIIPFSERVHPAEPKGCEQVFPLQRNTSAFVDLITEMTPIMQFIHDEQERQAEAIEALCLQMLYGNGGVHLGVLVHESEVIALDELKAGTTWKAWLTEDTEPGTVTYIPGWMSVDAWTAQFRRT